MKKPVLAFVAVFVVAPSALAVLVGSFLSPLALSLGMPPALVLLAVLGGWFGVAALSRVSSHYYERDDLPPAPRKAVAGLACGAAAAVGLLASAPGAFDSPVVFLWAPLLAAAYLGRLLWMSWPRALEVTDRGPLCRLLALHAERLQLMALAAVMLLGLFALLFA